MTLFHLLLRVRVFFQWRSNNHSMSYCDKSRNWLNVHLFFSFICLVSNTIWKYSVIVEGCNWILPQSFPPPTPKCPAYEKALISMTLCEQNIFIILSLHLNAEHNMVVAATTVNRLVSRNIVDRIYLVWNLISIYMTSAFWNYHKLIIISAAMTPKII